MAKAPAKGQKMQALYALHWKPDLTPAARAVGAWLVWHANASTGRCDPGQARLRAETGLSPRMIQYAIQSLIKAGLVSRRLRDQETSSYQVNWQRLSDITKEYETRAKEGNVLVVTPVERNGRGRKTLHLPGAKDCTYPVQGIAPKPSEGNTRKEPVFPVGTVSEGNGVLSDDDLAAKLLRIDADHAFLAALDREAQKGRRFRPEDAERIYARLEAIYESGSHSQGDPIAGRAYRLLETDLTREKAS